MKRENKFRVWCKNKNEWEKDPCLIDCAGNLYHMLHGRPMLIKPDTHIVEFFTGLKDKEGVEIYEGDFISAVKVWAGGPQEVRFVDGAFCSSIKGVPYQNDLNMFYSSGGCMIEVVGNIHENPEQIA